MRARPFALFTLCLAVAACGDDPAGNGADATDVGTAMMTDTGDEGTADAGVSDDADTENPDADVTDVDNMRPDIRDGLDAGVRRDAEPVRDTGGIPDARGDMLDATNGDATGPSGDGGVGADGNVGQDGNNIGRDATPVDTGPRPDAGAVTIVPRAATLELGASITLSSQTSTGALPVVWSVDGVTGGDTTTGTITVSNDPRVVTYTAPRASPALGVIRRVMVSVIGRGGEAEITLQNPTPVVNSITPDAIPAGSPTTTFTISGRGFTSSTRVAIDGVTIPAMFVDFETLTITIPGSLLSLPGVRRIMVTNIGPGGGTTTIEIRVMLVQVVVDPTIDPTIPTLFENANEGGDLERRPTITYPQNNSVAPRDFPAPRVSWNAPAPSNICRLRASAPTVTVDVYADVAAPLPPNANTSTTVSTNLWAQVTSVSFEELDLDLSVSCAQVVTPMGGAPMIADGNIYTSNDVRYTVSENSAGGRVVYFSGLIEGMWRIDIGGANAVGQPWIGPDPAFATTTPQCVGCHSFSRNGQRMSYISNAVVWNLGVAEVTNQRAAVVLDPLNGALGNWTSFHPTDDFVLSIDLTPNVTVLDGTSGQLLTTVATAPAGPRASQPTWSPTGTEFAFVSGNNGTNGVADVGAGRIFTVTASQATAGALPTFGPPRLLAAPAVQGGSAYYPSYSPDGRWVVFAQAPTGSSYNNAQGNLWLVSADGTVGPVPLTAANRGTGLANSWPRWAPSNQAGRYWVVFSSQREYPPFNGTGPQQLWVTRIDTTNLPADPSFPAIWLSGQEPFTGNLTAEWTVDR